MNFFKLYIGDYQRDTAHLSVTEHGAFLLMLQHYYATEKPLPTGKALHRMLRATEKAEREAIDSVVAQFWRETDGGLVNDRADEEIRKSEHQRTVNREMGKRGGRPKKTDSVTPEKTESVSGKEPTNNPNQTPDTRHQNQALRSGEGGNSSVVPTQAAAVCARLRSEAGMLSTNPSHPELADALANGITPDEIVHAAVENSGKPLTYVIRTAVGRRNDAAANAAGATHASPGTNPPARLTARDRALADNERHRQQRAGAGRVIDA